MSSVLEPIPQEEDEGPVEFTSLGTDGSSLFDDLRPANRKMRAAKTAEFDIPGYEQAKLDGKSALVARYRRILIGDFTEMQKQFQDAKGDRVFSLYADFLIDNCEEILKRAPDTMIELGCRYDLPLADGLRFEAASCRDVLRGVFGDNEIAVVEHAETVFAWMRTGKTADDEDALGKS